MYKMESYQTRHPESTFGFYACVFTNTNMHAYISMHATHNTHAHVNKEMNEQKIMIKYFEDSPVWRFESLYICRDGSELGGKGMAKMWTDMQTEITDIR